MGDRRRRADASWQGLAVSAVLAVAGGCAMVPPKSLIDPTKVGRFGFGDEPGESGIRRVLSPRETPPGLPNASEPVPEDLVAVYTDYRMVPGDVLGLTIPDLIEGGRPYSVAIEVSALGEIRLPELGTVKVAGLTELEVESELSERLREAALLPRPIVVAFVQQKRGRVFSMIGAVRGPGQYPLADPSLKLMEALAMAGGTDPTARKAYVIRQTSPRPLPVAPATPAPAAPPPVQPAAPPDERQVIPPPTIPPAQPPGGMMTTAGAAQEEPPPPTRAELRELIAPQQTQPAPPAEATQPAFPPLIFFDPKTGQVVEQPPPAPPPVVPPPPPPGAAPAETPAPQAPEEPFDWDAFEEPGLEQRIIAIDLAELRSGNPQQNIVVRDRDVISVPEDTGLFYVLGEVARPGVYAFGGRDITLKQAIAIVGGFTPLAWPARAELIRRESGLDRQTTRNVNLDAIFAGLEPDIYLKDEDVLNVGSDIVAPFLFVLRNSFRFTYGFGFVYDRNFADQDAYEARANPSNIELLRRQSRGLPF